MPHQMLEQVTHLADGYWRKVGDQRVHSNYPLMSGGPVPIVLIVSAYLYFVRVAGPKLMANRKPFQLATPIRLYNILMSLVNLYIFVRTAVLTNFGLSYFGCRQVGTSSVDNELVSLAFIYFASKIVELLDTIFFVLRKKYNQASNLHVFHHGFIAICVWIYFKVAPGGSSVLFPFLNTGVHSVMYLYYFAATFKSVQRHLWWKHHLTQAQIIQFILSMVHFSFQGLSSCNYPPALAIIGFSFNLVFLALFCNFYYHTYLRRPGGAGRAQATTETAPIHDRAAPIHQSCPTTSVQPASPRAHSPEPRIAEEREQEEREAATATATMATIAAPEPQDYVDENGNYVLSPISDKAISDDRSLKFAQRPEVNYPYRTLTRRSVAPLN